MHVFSWSFRRGDEPQYMGCDARNPVFEVLNFTRSKSRYDTITKALIRLCECAGWSVPLLLADRYSRVGAHVID